MIFLSYCWEQSDYADRLERYLKERHFTVLRDKNEIKNTDDISEFMRKLGSSDYAILLISEAYLKSVNCLYEAFIAYDGREKNNVIPIVFPDADVFDWRKQLAYIAFWHEKKERMEEEIKAVPQYKAVKLAEKIRQAQRYSSDLQDLLDYIEKRKCILSEDADGSLEQVCTCLYDKILSRELRLRPVVRCTDIRLPEEPMMALDFGTSYTLVSVVDERGKVLMIPNERGEYIHRSTIEFSGSGGYQIGTESPGVIRHIKRAIGLRESMMVGKSRYSIPLLVAMILRSMARNAEEFLGMELRRVIMAVPTDFSLSQRQVLRESARIAGLEVVRFVQEPAAETHLAPQLEDELYGCVAFIDMGGGTLDITLAEVGDGVCEVLYSDGDGYFGSLDYEERIENLLKHKLSVDHGIEAKKLGFLAEQIKCMLGKRDHVTVSYNHASDSGDIQTIALTVTRKEFESVTDKLSRKFTEKLLKLQAEAGESLKAVYLTGQGTKLYVLRRLIEIVFPDTEVIDQYQESALIRGLSIQNQILAGKARNRVLLDAFASSIVVMCRACEKKQPAVISARDNRKKCILLEANCAFPTLAGVVLKFEAEEGTPSANYPLEVWEETASGKRNLLVNDHFKPKQGKDYVLLFDMDANSRCSIRVQEESPDHKQKAKTVREYRLL